MLLASRHALIWAALATITVTAPAFAQRTDQPLARRIAAVSSIALDEYALGVQNGKVVSENEVREARLFLAEARQSAEQLPAVARATVIGAIDRLRQGVDAAQPADSLRRDLAFLRHELERTLGIALDPLPAAPPSLARGARLFAQFCASCHGPRGAGDGPQAPALHPPPADLTQLALLRGQSPVDFFRKINVGVAGTAMPAFGTRLTLEDRWSLALYASALRYTDSLRAEGAAQLPVRCPACIAQVGGLPETAAVSDDSLAALIAAGIGDTTGADMNALVAFARTAAAEEVLGGDARLQALRAARRVEAGADEAVRLAVQGARSEAGQRALDAYLVFEEIENAVAARNAGAASGVEQTFAAFRSALATGSVDEIQAAEGRVREALDRTVEVMSQSTSPTMLFGQSLLIIVREGLEAILILGALTAVVVKSGSATRSREINWGAGAAVLASLVTAAAFATLFRFSSGHREAMEGVTLLLAAAVLFWVASWLVSKVETEKWRAFVGAQMRKALSSRGAFALAGVAFLAVYREGVETVLFYGALFGTAGSASGVVAVALGIVVGAVVLGIVYVAIRHYGLRLPLKPFFAVTGILLSLMTVSFVGQGIAELQAAGWVSATPLHWLPSLPVLGLFPTVQTVLAQSLIVGAFALALAWIFWFSPPAEELALRRAGR